MSSSFKLPSIHSFPPFFTRQPHEETWCRQRELWCQLILSYCRHNKIFSINRQIPSKLTSQSNQSLTFILTNESIKRTVDQSMFDELAMYMLQSRQLTAIRTENNESSSTVAMLLVWWRTRQEWATIIMEYAQRYGLDLCTAYELFEGEDTTDQEFHALPYSMITEIMLYLQNQGKVTIIASGGTSRIVISPETGLKFDFFK